MAAVSEEEVGKTTARARADGPGDGNRDWDWERAVQDGKLGGDVKSDPEPEPEPEPEPGKKEKEKKGQSSFLTILAVLNMTIGTSLFSMPWALNKADLVFGTAVLVFMGCLVFYSCYRISMLQHDAGLSSG